MPVLRHVKAHVGNTPVLLEHFNKPSIAERKGKIPVSFDVVSLYTNTSRPCRTLFGYCPPPALGSRKADMKTLSFFFPTPYPCHVARKQLSSPDIMGGRAACALHSFLLPLSMIMAGYVGVPCSYQQTLSK